MCRAWYSFNGGTTTTGSNYVLMTTKPNCINGTNICAIYAPDCGANPSGPLSSNMQRYISNAVGTGLAQPQVPVNGRKYVYLKTTTP